MTRLAGVGVRAWHRAYRRARPRAAGERRDHVALHVIGGDRHAFAFAGWRLLAEALDLGVRA